MHLGLTSVERYNIDYSRRGVPPELTYVPFENTVEYARKYGFNTVAIPSAYLKMSRDQIDTLLDGLRISYVASFRSLVLPDEKIMHRNIELSIEELKLSAENADGASILSCLGSLNSGPWGVPGFTAWSWANYTPENYSEKALRIAKNSLKQVVKIAEEYDVDLILEPLWTSVWGQSPKHYRRIIDEVGSDNLKINCDIGNFMNSYERYYRNTDFINEFFDTLHGHIASAHGKDVIMEEKHQISIVDTYLGGGNIDFETVLRRLNDEAGPEAHFVVEHLQEHQIPNAINYIKKLTDKLGIKLS
jgi:sugar phosphate isomerase/epimerase